MSERGERERNNDDKAALYRKLDQDDLIRMEQIFKSSEEQKFTIDELENVLKEFHISFSPDRLKSFFLKVKDNFFLFFNFNVKVLL